MFNPEKPPELAVSRWFNTEEPQTLAKLKGRVVVLLAFQMLCQGSRKHGLPQAHRFTQRFAPREVAVIGLHTVFQNHEEMSPEKLEDFIEKSGVRFPIGVDAPAGAKPPKTMTAYELRGTPSILVFDRQGRLRRHYMGEVDDIRLAADTMALAIEENDAPRERSVAIERALAAALVEPEAHRHDGECCGGHGHDHSHDHGHSHEHAHDHEGGCCGGEGHADHK